MTAAIKKRKFININKPGTNLIAKAKTLKYLCIYFLFFQINGAAFEQNSTTPVKDSTSASFKSKPALSTNINGQITWYKMFADIPYDYTNFFYNSFQVKEIPTLLTFGAVTGAVMLADQPGWKYNNSLVKKYQSVSKLTDLSVKMGDGKYQFLSAALFAVPGLIFRDETAIRTGSNIVEAVISSGLFVQLLKRATGRQSPSASTENGGDWDPFPSIKQYQKNQPAYYSFPSGHLSTATAILTVIANNYPDEKWIKPAGYPLLGLLGVSLVSKGMHWYSDLPLAYFLGYSFGNIIAPERKMQDQGKSSLIVAPSINYNGAQLGVIYNF